MCPAHVAGEDVGGMAFACRGTVSRNTAFIGEAVSNILLSYLRLREDALAHMLVEEQQKLAEAKRIFIDRLSHDLRHPIDALQSTVAEFSKAFSIINQQIAQINRMMDETIVVLEGGDPKTMARPSKREDKVSEFLDDLRSYFATEFAGKQKQLLVEPVDPSWSIRLDPRMVHEALENLIVNSIEHGGKLTRVYVERLPDRYLFHVQDNGLGIPEQQREFIFRPRPTREGSSKPRGRGLAIAKFLAENHGGSLRLGPPEGPWTTNFILEVPIDNEENQL